MNDQVLITFDRGFGALIVQGTGPLSPGAILLRFVPEFPEEAAHRVLGVMETPGISFEGRFTVIERERVRQRRIRS